MNSDMKVLWERISATMDEGAALTKYAYEGIKADVRDLIELGEVRLRSLIDMVVENETIRQIATVFFANVKKGKVVAVEALRREHAKYEQKMEELVDDKPEIVGFWDGFVCVFLSIPADRRSKSKIYAIHAKYGKVVGVLSAILFFLPAGGVRTVLGALPVLVRGTQYLQKKVMEAKGKVKSSKQPTGPVRPAAKTEEVVPKPVKKESERRKKATTLKRGVYR